MVQEKSGPRETEVVVAGAGPTGLWGWRVNWLWLACGSQFWTDFPNPQAYPRLSAFNLDQWRCLHTVGFSTVSPRETPACHS
jgi:hypothetical protein